MLRLIHRCASLGFCLAALLCCSARAQQVNSKDLTIVTDHPTGIYGVNDTAHFLIEWKGAGKPPAQVHYVLKQGGLKQVGEGDVSLVDNKAVVDAKLAEPDTMLIDVTWQPDGPHNLSAGGFVVEPDQIQPAVACPSDFDSFWKSNLDELSKIGFNPQLKEEDAGVADVTYDKVTLDGVNGTHVDGQLAKPSKGDKFPAVLVMQYAGVYALQKSWVTQYATQGWLAMDIEAHDIPIDKDAKYYQDLYADGGALHNYWLIGNADRSQSYYLRMYLSCVQSLHYLRSRPDWDGKTIIITGQSQGGQQALMLAGLCPDEVTAALTLVPAACDMWAPSIGRASGFPDWWDQTWGGRDADKVHQTSKYFDPVNFAMRIKCPVLVALGLHDNLAPPSSVLAATNQIHSSKEVLILPLSGHSGENNSQQLYYNRVYGAWLPALLKGEPPAIATE